MTMTSVVIGPGSLSAPTNMITSKRYHLQQGLSPTSVSPTSVKSYDTLSKGKKSWSVRLGLSRQSQSAETSGKGWGTISGGSVISRQMIYGEPWLYGTVRSSRPGHDPRAFLAPLPPPGAPVLVVCSCSEFLNGTARKLGNCRKCGGHRLFGIPPLGGTCRVPPTPARVRPSLAGILRSSVDDPYDLMRRNRLVEPRSRARSSSPHRPGVQRDSRCQSMARNAMDRKGTSDAPSVRSEWFDVEADVSDAETKDSQSLVAVPGRLMRVTKRPKINVTNHWPDSTRLPEEKPVPPTAPAADPTRKSILECDVNPYLLVKKRSKDEDNLSDDLSDNALEQEDEPPSSLFDPSKVKSIERIPKRSSVAAIGGQRIRVFNEVREISDEDEAPPCSRIPAPKISPKRPPRRLKEAKATLKSILKRGRSSDNKRKNVLFNVGNVIFAPEKPSDVAGPSRRTSKSSIGSFKDDLDHQEQQTGCNSVQDCVDDKPKFITIPNIREHKRQSEWSKQGAQETKIPAPTKTGNLVQKIEADKSTSYRKNVVSTDKSVNKKNEESDVNIDDKERNDDLVNSSVQIALKEKKAEKVDNKKDAETAIKPRSETELENEIENLKDRLPGIAVDEKDLILKSEGKSKRSHLFRSQSERAISRMVMSTGDVNFVDTMRLSISRKSKDVLTESNSSPNFLLSKGTKQQETVSNKYAERSRQCNSVTEEVKTENEEDDDEKRSRLRKTETEESLMETKIIEQKNLEHFQNMRPTSWSPPPGKLRHSSRNRVISDSDVTVKPNIGSNTSEEVAWKCPSASTNGTTSGSSRIAIGSRDAEKNICKITVSPDTSPLVHRLRIDSGVSTVGSGKTSILINGNQDRSTKNGNKVTISVGGEDSVCNPTVIAVNSQSYPRVQTSTENRTLVILDNYRSNIIVKSRENHSENEEDSDSTVKRKKDDSPKSPRNEKKTTKRRRKQERKVSKQNFSSPDNKDVTPDNSESAGLSKEALISKLLEDSLRKARENGEILDESSGEAILKILKQSLLKSKEYESSESTLEPDASYSRASSVHSEADFVSTSLFLDENPYEVIKEPIYEEIPDEPPPLPLSPPPSEIFVKERIYFGDEFKEMYYRKINEGQFIGSYLSDNVFKKPAADGGTEFFKKEIALPGDEKLSTKFEILDFFMNSKDHVVPLNEEEVEGEEEEDTERDLEALYEQKETSLGDLSSKSSQISNVSDSSEECNIILTSSPETLKARTVDIERTDSGVGSESSQASSGRGVSRRWRTGNASSGPGSFISVIPQVTSGDTKLCEDCEQRLEPLITDSGVVYAPFVCRKCSKKRAERKEIITEIVETEQKYGRDLQIILEEFHRPILRAGLLTQEQLSAIFLNVEELLEHNLVLAEKLKDAVELAQESGDEDLLTVDVGKIFLESERMLHAFESYCTRQGSASLLLQNLEKEKDFLRIFLKESQMENTVLRRMNLNSFLMVPVQRVTKYPLLLARLLKATPSVHPDVQEAKKRLQQAQTNIELHLEHMNAEAKDVTSTKLWRRISIIQNGRRSTGEQDMVNIKLRKMAVEVLDWAHEEARFVLEGRLLVAQPTDNNWRRGRTVKLAPVTAMLVTNGKSNTEFLDLSDDSLFPKQIGVKDATLLLIKEKIGRYSLLREPLHLDKCIVCCETDFEDYFEIQELTSKETYVFKAEDGERTKRWCRTLQIHAQSLGAWRRRRGALPNIMICGVARD